jgi:hypothetical protein
MESLMLFRTGIGCGAGASGDADVKGCAFKPRPQLVMAELREREFCAINILLF